VMGWLWALRSSTITQLFRQSWLTYNKATLIRFSASCSDQQTLGSDRSPSHL
jgi:hypothetical protein